MTEKFTAIVNVSGRPKIFVVARVGAVVFALTALIVIMLNSFVVVAAEADTVVALIVSGILTAEAVYLLNVGGALYSLRDRGVQKRTAAITVRYFGFIYRNSAAANFKT